MGLMTNDSELPMDRENNLRHRNDKNPRDFHGNRKNVKITRKILDGNCPTTSIGPQVGRVLELESVNNAMGHGCTESVAATGMRRSNGVYQHELRLIKRKRLTNAQDLIAVFTGSFVLMRVAHGNGGGTFQSSIASTPKNQGAFLQWVTPYLILSTAIRNEC